jgi:hypothetical protein
MYEFGVLPCGIIFVPGFVKVDQLVQLSVVSEVFCSFL